MKSIRHRIFIVLTLWVVVVWAPVVFAEELLVSAAASLTDAFRDMETAFEADHPGVDVVMNFASSGALYRQIVQGAPADVYASANPKWMAKTVEKGLASRTDVAVFAHNAMALAVPAGNPAGISTLSDLAGNGTTRIGIGTPATVPAGQYARSALVAADMYTALSPKFIFCEHVRQVLDYLSRGEVDAGFVYRTDGVRAGNKVKIITEIPLPAPVAYPIVALKGSAVPDLAQTFVDFATGTEGRALLAARGFKPPQ